jgi:NADH-quinone oxidoreductase subunit G
VKLCEQITDGRVHGVIHRGDHAEISTYIEQAIENDFSGNVIDVCPVGALTDRTFRFKSRVWNVNPVEAHRNCDKCCGKVRLWFKGNDILRVTARRDAFDEVAKLDNGEAGWICNECRFDKKHINDWVIEGEAHIDRQSVISAHHYEKNEASVEIPNLPQFST